MKILLMVIFLFLPQFSFATESVSMMGKDGKNISSQIADLYLLGAKDGMAVLNAYLISRGRSPLYCAPPNLELSPAQFLKLAETQLVGPHEPSVILIAATQGLIEKFPCTAK